MANEWLKKYRKDNHLCVECGEPTDKKPNGNYYSLCDNCNMKKLIKSGKITLCWACRNAVPDRRGEKGCNWSRKKKPVDGWEATPTECRVTRGLTVPSFHVKSCPEFVEG